jgi:hypothetical protein
MRTSIVAALISIILLIFAAPTLAEVYPECQVIATPVVSGTPVTVTQDHGIDYSSYTSVWMVHEKPVSGSTWSGDIILNLFSPLGVKLILSDTVDKDQLSFAAPVVTESTQFRITYGVKSKDPKLVDSCDAWKCYIITVNPPECTNLVVSGCKYCIEDQSGTGTYTAIGTIANNPALTYVWQIKTASTEAGLPTATWNTLTDESGKVSGATTSTLVINWNSYFPTNVNKMFYQIQLIVSNKAGGQSWSQTITNCPCAGPDADRSYISVYKRPTITTSITPST